MGRVSSDQEIKISGCRCSAARDTGCESTDGKKRNRGEPDDEQMASQGRSQPSPSAVVGVVQEVVGRQRLDSRSSNTHDAAVC